MVATALLDQANELSTIILGGIAMIGAIVGALSWIDRRIDTRIGPVVASLDELLKDVQLLRRHQREIARSMGLNQRDDDKEHHDEC